MAGLFPFFTPNNILDEFCVSIIIDRVRLVFQNTTQTMHSGEMANAYNNFAVILAAANVAHRAIFVTNDAM